jgi:hypothetical protein
MPLARAGLVSAGYTGMAVTILRQDWYAAGWCYLAATAGFACPARWRPWQWAAAPYIAAAAVTGFVIAALAGNLAAAWLAPGAAAVALWPGPPSAWFKFRVELAGGHPVEFLRALAAARWPARREPKMRDKPW